jgi:hypothetical protein
MNHRNYLPRGDRGFLTWITVFLLYLMSRLTKFKVPQEEYDGLEQEKNVYAQKLDVANADATRTPMNIKGKNDAKKVLEKHVRKVVKEYLINNHLLTNEDLMMLGLPIHDTTPTPAPVPEDMPVCKVDISTHRQHSVHVTPGIPVGKSKPPKVHGFEVWGKVGGNPPADDTEWTYVNFSSRSPLRISYPTTDVGKTAYYQARWVNSRNQPGPWSESYVVAVIA